MGVSCCVDAASEARPRNTTQELIVRSLPAFPKDGEARVRITAGAVSVPVDEGSAVE
jgi:hypothetical protein